MHVWHMARQQEAILIRSQVKEFDEIKFNHPKKILVSVPDRETFLVFKCEKHNTLSDEDLFFQRRRENFVVDLLMTLFFRLDSPWWLGRGKRCGGMF